MMHGGPDPYADGHAGEYGGFTIFWADTDQWTEPDNRPNQRGWYISILDDDRGEMHGPFITSQEAFCAMVEAIDQMLSDVESGRVSEEIERRRRKPH